MQALRDLSRNEGATVIIVTHDPEVAALATRIFEMRDGEILGYRIVEKSSSRYGKKNRISALKGINKKPKK